MEEIVTIEGRLTQSSNLSVLCMLGFIPEKGGDVQFIPLLANPKLPVFQRGARVRVEGRIKTDYENESGLNVRLEPVSIIGV
jgi:hypothetical protein